MAQYAILIYASDSAHALEIAGRNPAIQDGGGVEVRPIHSSVIAR